MELILVVDDEPKITQLVRSYLEHAGFRTLVAADGAEALNGALTLKPDLIVLDLMLPGLDGFEVTRRIRQTTDVPIIMLTARNEETDRLTGLDLGADDYVTKPFSPRELVARVRAVLRRAGARRVVPRSASATGGEIADGNQRAGAPGEGRSILTAGAGPELVIDPSRREVLCDGSPVSLTSYQFELLYLLVSRPGHVFSRASLVEAMQGSSYEGYERTVDAHMKNLRKALADSAEEPRFIETVRGAGYRFRDRR